MNDQRIIVEITKSQWVEVCISDEGLVIDVYETDTMNSLATSSATWGDLGVTIEPSR